MTAYVGTVDDLGGHFAASGDRVVSISSGFHVTREIDGRSRTVQVVWARPDGLVHFSAGTDLGVVPDDARARLALELCQINAALPVPGFVFQRRLAFRTSVPVDHQDCISIEVAERCVDYAMDAVARNLTRLRESLEVRPA